jgi:hypothetical protein
MRPRPNFTVLKTAAIAVAILAASTAVHAQVTVNVPFKFEAGGKPFPPGEYAIELKKDGAVGLRSAAGGTELVIPAAEKRKPARPIQQPELVFDMVGNFEPSFSEYVTDSLLSEIWLPGGADGVIVLTTTAKHDHRTVHGRLAATRP